MSKKRETKWGAKPTKSFLTQTPRGLSLSVEMWTLESSVCLLITSKPYLEFADLRSQRGETEGPVCKQLSHALGTFLPTYT